MFDTLNDEPKCKSSKRLFGFQSGCYSSGKILNPSPIPLTPPSLTNIHSLPFSPSPSPPVLNVVSLKLCWQQHWDRELRQRVQSGGRSDTLPPEGRRLQISLRIYDSAPVFWPQSHDITHIVWQMSFLVVHCSGSCGEKWTDSLCMTSL